MFQMDFLTKHFIFLWLIKTKILLFQEMYFINSCDIPDFISKNDLSIHLWDCDSKFPNDWKLIC
jgi:hypothetical protein